MKIFCISITFIFLCFYLKAQQALPNGTSYFWQSGLNKPIKFYPFRIYDDPYSTVTMNSIGGLSTSIGITRFKENFTFSAALRSCYFSGSSHTQYNYLGSSHSTKDSKYTVGKIGSEFIWYSRLGKNQNFLLGAGLHMDFCAYQHANTTSTYYSSSNQSLNVYTYQTNIGKIHLGSIFDLRYNLKKRPNKNHCSSLGLRLISSQVFYTSPELDKYSEVEVYFSYNFWKQKKPIALDSSLNSSVRSLNNTLPKGTSYFSQIAYNRPKDYSIGDGHYFAKGVFNHGASCGLGLNDFTEKVLISPMVKYTYTSGIAKGGDGGNGGGSSFQSNFYLGKISGELCIDGALGDNKKLFLGGGLVFGVPVYKNINGKQYSYSGMNNSTKELTNNYFSSKYAGVIVDLKYFLTKFEKANSGCAIGAKYYFTTSVIPYKYSQSEFEIYVSYNFWKKKKASTDDVKGPIGATKTGKLRRWGKEKKEEQVNWNHQHDK